MVFIFNFVFAFFIPVTADESYYLLWSKHLALSYFDHPPLVAYLLRVSTALFGVNPFGIRFFPLLVSVFLPLLWSKIFKESDLPLFLAFAFSPVLQIVMFFMTPDIPFYLFSSLFIYDYIKKREPSLWGGIFLGLSLLSKYTAVIIYLPVFYLMLRKNLKRVLFYYGIIPAIMFLPVVYFNHVNNWVSFKFQLSHGSGGFHFKPQFFLKYVLDILVVAGLPLSVFGVFHFFKLKREKFFLYLMGLSYFLFFAFFSLFSRQEANWPILFYPVLLYAGYKFTEGNRFRPYILLSFFLLSFPIKPLLLIPQIKNKVFRKEIVMKDIAERIKGSDLPVFANTYQHASLLSYYLGEEVLSLNIKLRKNQFDLWRNSIPDGEFILVATPYPDVMSLLKVDTTLFVFNNIGAYKARKK